MTMAMLTLQMIAVLEKIQAVGADTWVNLTSSHKMLKSTTFFELA